MSSPGLLVMLALNLWGMLSGIGVIRKSRYVGHYDAIGSLRVMTVIMAMTVLVCTVRLMQRHVHVVF
jgi:hypothetical protein